MAVGPAFRRGTPGKHPAAQLLFLASLLAGTVVGIARTHPPGIGTLEGKVLFAGAAPPPEVTPIRRDREACGPHSVSESLLVGPDRELRNVVVSVQGAAPPPNMTKTSVRLDNVNCRFEPHVQAAVVGSTLEMGNQDPILHNVHAYFDMEFNLAIPFKGMTLTRPIKSPGEVVFRCDIHEWMQAYLRVFPHLYFAVTGKDGKFRIAGVPEGQYDVEFWHERIDAVTRKVRIEAGRTASIELEMKLEKS